MFLISDALAATPALAGKGGIFSGGLQGLALPAILLVVFYFLLIRPQQKRAKAQKLLLNSVERGDKVVTNSGIVGIISKPVNPEDTEVSLEIATGVTILLKRASIGAVEKKSADKNVGKEKIVKKSKKDRKLESKNKNEDTTKEVEESTSNNDTEDKTTEKESVEVNADSTTTNVDHTDTTNTEEIKKEDSK